MCGIGGIFSKRSNSINLVQSIVKMSEALGHRGPDGEGFMTFSPQGVRTYYRTLRPEPKENHYPWLPQEALPDTIAAAQLIFMHRRLSIIDLSAGGHQPMCDGAAKVWLTFNGEIYNYKELKQELQELGHAFFSDSDSEVLLAAYKQWQEDCVLRFNGMWSFVIFDLEKKKLFASRDRLGVKPFYFANTEETFAFASEQKALVKGGFVNGKANEKAVAAYLLQGALERSADNFFEGITELLPGHSLTVDMNSGQLSTKTYYELQQSISDTNELKTDKEITQLVWQRLDDAVRLRLRSDVEVGTCLSGGIDSSALAVIMARHTLRPVHCFTSIFPKEVFNEETYAESVCLKIKGQHHKIEPNADGFFRDLNDLIYSQDVPIWSTSTYAQHQVMRLAAEHRIKVVLDGQGADELFAGYHHHFMARWNQLLAEGKRTQLLKELLQAGKSIPQPLVFYLKQKMKGFLNPRDASLARYFSKDFINALPPVNEHQYHSSLNAQLKDDIERTRLKIFLKCEDRAGMWHGVESRTPFSDDLPLIETAFSFDGQRKIKGGISKFFLREAVKPLLPEEVYARYDKIGFETPLKSWLGSHKSSVLEEISAANFPFLRTNAINSADFSNTQDTALLFKLLVLARWQNLFHS